MPEDASCCLLVNRVAYRVYTHKKRARKRQRPFNFCVCSPIKPCCILYNTRTTTRYLCIWRASHSLRRSKHTHTHIARNLCTHRTRFMAVITTRTAYAIAANLAGAIARITRVRLACTQNGHIELANPRRHSHAQTARRISVARAV